DWLEYDYNVPAVAISGAPVGWWKFDEGTGSTTTADSSANSNHGDITHASWTVGYPNDPCNSGLRFDGDGIAKYDKVVCAELVGSNPGTYPAELMPAAFTVACWVKVDNFEYYGTFVSNGNDDDASDQCGFYLHGNENRSFGLVIRTETGYYYPATPGIYNEDTWYHVAGTYDDDANTVSVYVDGKLMAGPTNVGGPISWVSPFTESYPDYFAIGGLPLRDSQDWYYHHGFIDDVRLYDYAMPHGEVVTLAEQVSVYQDVTSAANIYDLEAKLSKKVNFMDYGLMADHWLEGPTLWP
ncbi:MAG: LamG domain-containing protein, partial [Planctomycetota bacterium]